MKWYKLTPYKLNGKQPKKSKFKPPRNYHERYTMGLSEVMKFGELVTVFSVLFLVTFSMGDGAPQWRPQGRFGKRLDQRFPSPWQQISGTDKDIDVYPVLEEQTDVQPNNVDNIINVLKKVCVESNVPGLFKCYRRTDSGFRSSSGQP
nr:uncharacterized protein LOC105342458 [Crassostrea gigas]